MLEQITPHEFDELYAAHCVGLDPESWMRTATMTAALWEQLELIRVMIATHITGKKQKLEQRDPRDFLPSHYRQLMGER